MHLEEVLAALPDVGLRVVNLGERPGLKTGRWSVQLSNSAYGNPHADIYWHADETPLAAVLGALKLAGVNIDPD